MARWQILRLDKDGEKVLWREPRNILFGRSRSAALRKRNKLRKKHEAWFGTRRFRAKHTRDRSLAPSDALDTFQAAYGLSASSKDPASPGVHSATSFHYALDKHKRSRGRDFGVRPNTKMRLRKAASDLRGNTRVGGVVNDYEGNVIKELFGPFDWYIKNGVVRAGSFPNHGDHLHIAL